MADEPTTPPAADEGRSAEEWLRCLGDQQRALRQRAAFTGRDHNNQLLLAGRGPAARA